MKTIMENKEFKTLSEKEIRVYTGDVIEGCDEWYAGFYKKDVKEFFKNILTPNNISKGFVEVSTIKYYAGDKLI